MLAMRSVPLGQLVLPTESRRSGPAEYTGQKDGGPPHPKHLPYPLATAPNSTIQTQFFCLGK